MSLIYQSVTLNVDLAADCIFAETTLIMCQPRAEEETIRLHCRQVQIQKVCVNDEEAEFTRVDALSDLFPRARSCDSETTNGPFDGGTVDVHYRAALELARRGELAVTIPPTFCVEVIANEEEESASSHSGDAREDESSEEPPATAAPDSNEKVVVSTDTINVYATSNVSPDIPAQSISEMKREHTSSIELAHMALEVKEEHKAGTKGHNGSVVETTLSEFSVTKEMDEQEDMSICPNSPGETHEPAPINPELYRAIQFLPSLPMVPNLSKSIAGKWSDLKGEIDKCINSGGRVLKIVINYVIDRPVSGLIFRKEKKCSSGTSIGHGPSRSDGSLLAALLSSSVGIHPAYGCGGGGGAVGGLNNVDGVRCWLPCIDDPHQRAVFDTTVSLSLGSLDQLSKRTVTNSGLNGVQVESSYDLERIKSNYLLFLCKLSVLCSGVFIPPDLSTLSEFPAENLAEGRTPIVYRYVTVQPIPVSCLGVFVGCVQTFRSPVYGSTGFVCVSAPASLLENTLLMELDDEACFDLQEMWACHCNALTQPLKDTRQFQFMESTQARRGIPSTNLPAKLQDTFLGLEQATRYLQRSLGKRYPNRQYCHIIHPEIQGCASTWGDGGCHAQFLAFDGFTMFQEHSLCASVLMPFLEASSHLTLVSGFLTSWLSSGIPISSFDNEFIITGAIGYLLGDYISYVYGDADGRVYMLKLYDTIVALESQGVSQGTPLVNSLSDVPSGYELFGLSISMLLKAKSVVFMYLIEHRLGRSSDVMKGRVLKCLMSACPDFSNKHASIRLHRNLLQAHAPQQGGHGGLFPPASPQNVQSPHHTPAALGMAPPSAFSSRAASNVLSFAGNPIFPPESPQYSASPHPFQRSDIVVPQMPPPSMTRNTSTQSNSIFPPESPQYSASPNPSHRYDVPSSTGLSRQPSLQSTTIFPPESPQYSASPHTWQGQQMPPPSVPRAAQLTDGPFDRREGSLTKEAPREENPACYTYVDPHILLEICRAAAGGAVMDLEQDFIDRCLYSSGVVLMRVGAVLDKKNKKLELVAQQIAYSGGRAETQLSAELKGNKNRRRKMSSAMPYLFNKLDFHVVSGGEVWRYSRALESYTQAISVSIYTKPKKVGRKRLIDTLTANAATEATNYNDVRNIDELDDAHIEKALTSLQQVRAAMFNEALQVSFVSLDPDLLYIRHINMSGFPVSFSVEQLFTDADELGQLRALRALASTPPLPESVSDTMLRLTALSDCLKEACLSDKNSDSVGHHVYVRAMAAMQLAAYQNAHAPKLSTADTPGSWIAMKSILNAYIQFYYIYPADYLSSRQHASGSFHGKVPGPYALDDISSTFLRSAMLLALSSIRARSGITPVDVIDLLLNQGENVYIKTDIGRSEDSGTFFNDTRVSSFDDSHACCVVLLSLSRIRVSTYLSVGTHSGKAKEEKAEVSEGNKLCHAVLDRIRAVADFYLQRDLVFIAADGRMGEGNDTVTAASDAGGILTASALQCMCEVDCQLHPVLIRRPPAVIMDKRCGGSYVQTDDVDVFSYSPVCDSDRLDYFAYLDSTKYSPLVRSSAIECILKLMICSLADHQSVIKRNGHLDRRPRAGSDGTLSGPADDSASIYIPSGTDLINVALFVVTSDPDVCVRRNTAQALLSVVQQVCPLRASVCAISLGSVMETFDWSEPSGLCAIGHHKSLLFGQFKQGLTGRQGESRIEFSQSTQAFSVVQHFANDSCPSMCRALAQLKDTITNHVYIATDQVTRSTLFRVWLVLFGSSKPPAISSHIEAQPEILVPSDFSFLDPARLVVPNPLHSLNDVNNLLTWGDQLECLSDKAFSTAVPLSTTVRSLPENKVAQKESERSTVAGKGAGMLRILSSASVGATKATNNDVESAAHAPNKSSSSSTLSRATLSIKRPRPEGAIAGAGPGPGAGMSTIKKPRFRLGSSTSANKLV